MGVSLSEDRPGSVSGSLRKVTFQRFSAGPIFQQPTISFPNLPGPAFRRWSPGEHSGEMEPDQTFRGLTGSGVAFVPGGYFDLPAIRRGLGDNKREWGFCKLHEGGAVGLSGHEYFPGDLRSPAFGFPDSLALTDGPTGFF